MTKRNDLLPAKVHGEGGVAQLLETMKPQLATALARHLDPNRFVRVALTTLQRTPALLRCTKESFFGSLMECAQLGLAAARAGGGSSEWRLRGAPPRGLAPDGACGRAYLIPYGDKCQLVPGYRGLLELMRRSGDVLDCYSEVVREGDHFEVVKGLHRDLIHEPATGNEEAPITHVYNVAILKNGLTRFEVMTFNEVEKIRKDSKSGNSGPWKNSWSRMALKTVLRRHANWLPSSAELRQAMALDDRQFEAARPREPDVLDISALEITAPPAPKKVRKNGNGNGKPKVSKELPAARAAADEAGLLWQEGDSVDMLREAVETAAK